VLPCADVPLLRKGPDQSERLDWVNLAPWRCTVRLEEDGSGPAQIGIRSVVAAPRSGTALRPVRIGQHRSGDGHHEEVRRQYFRTAALTKSNEEDFDI
jgi:hypothetical protein